MYGFDQRLSDGLVKQGEPAMSDGTFGSRSGGWAPIADLLPIDLVTKSDELPALAEVWKEERKSLLTDDSLKSFNERLLREWSIETGIIEHLYTLDITVAVSHQVIGW